MRTMELITNACGVEVYAYDLRDMAIFDLDVSECGRFPVEDPAEYYGITQEEVDALRAANAGRDMYGTTVGSWFRARLGRAIVDPHAPLVAGETADCGTLIGCPLDSVVGQDCQRMIDAAATLIGAGEGGFDNIVEDVERVCLVFMYS